MEKAATLTIPRRGGRRSQPGRPDVPSLPEELSGVEPTSVSNRVGEILGTAKHSIGSLTGSEDTKRDGEAQATEAKAKSEAEGTVGKGVGKVQETWGDVTDDKETEVKGRAKQVEGDIERAGQATGIAPCDSSCRALADLRADHGGDLRPKELDGAHDLGVLQRAHDELQQEPVVVEDLVLMEDLVDDLLRAAGEGVAVELVTDLVGVTRDRGEASFLADAVHQQLRCRPGVVGGGL